MKVRMFAVLSILSLAAWLPMQAQQAAAPAAPAQQSSAHTATDDSKAAKHDGYCPAKGSATADAGKDCCHGKASAEGKSTCCEGNDAQAMTCCSHKAEVGKSAADCYEGMKDAQCAAKDGKSCCEKMNAGNQKGCCAGMHDQCPMDASGK